MQYPGLGDRLMAELEPDPKFIETLASAYEGNAQAHYDRAATLSKADFSSRMRGNQDYILAASSYVISGSYWLLINVREALRLFRRATHIYRDVGHDYWIVLELVSGRETDIDTMLSATDELREPSAQAIAFRMVANEISNTKLRGQRMEQLRAQWHHVGNRPVGRLGISLDHFARLAQAIRVARDNQDRDRFLAETANYINRAAEVIRTASHDEFHWRLLQSTVFSAEPEAVAMTKVMSITSHLLLQLPINELLNLDSQGRLLAQVGEELRSVSTSEEGPQPLLETL